MVSQSVIRGTVKAASKEYFDINHGCVSHSALQIYRCCCEGRKELLHMTVRQQLVLVSKITGAFLFRKSGRFLHVPTTQIYCLTSAIISETHKIIITMHNTKRSSTWAPLESQGRGQHMGPPEASAGRQLARTRGPPGPGVPVACGRLLHSSVARWPWPLLNNSKQGPNKIIICS